MVARLFIIIEVMNLNKLFLLFLVLFPIVTKAQYYNPYSGHNVEACSGKVSCGACGGINVQVVMYRIINRL